MLHPWIIPIESNLVPSSQHSCLIGVDCHAFEKEWNTYNQSLYNGFTQDEHQYCQSRARPFESFAGRWAVKQAAAKLSAIEWTWFEVIRTDEGVPSLHCTHSLWKDSVWEISITHDHTWAYALVCLISHPPSL